MHGRTKELLGQLDVLLPCIVVLGNENHGKSTLLERIVGLPFFPHGMGLCTRMVIRVELRRGDATPATVDVVDLSVSPAKVVNTIQCEESQVEETVRDSMRKALSTHASDSAVLKTHELRVRIQRPNFPTLDLVDVPGLVASARQGLSPDTPEVTRALAESVILRYKETAMFLIVVDSRGEANQSLVGPLVLQHKLKDHSLGVWTKLDIYRNENKDDSGALKRKVRERTLELKFGWCACCTPQCDDIDKDGAEATKLKEKGFGPKDLPPDLAEYVGLPAVRRLIEKFFGDFVKEYWLPLVLGKVKDRLVEFAVSHSANGLPNAPSSGPARQRTLVALSSEALVNCRLSKCIATQLEALPVTKLPKHLADAVEAAQRYAGDHTALGRPAIAEALASLEASVAAPAEYVTMNCAGARAEELRAAAFCAIRDFTKLLCESVKGPDGRRARMIAALESHPSKWLQRFTKVKAALTAKLDDAVEIMVAGIQQRTVKLLSDNFDEFVQIDYRPSTDDAPPAVIRTSPLVVDVARRVFNWVFLDLERFCGWDVLRQSIPGDPALWTELDCEAALVKVAEAAEVLKYFSEVPLRSLSGGQSGPITITDDRDLLLAVFYRCEGKPANWARDKPLADWTGVKVNANGDAVSLDVSGCQMRGTPDLTMLPPKLELLNLSKNKFNGRADLSKLPLSLQELHLGENEFSMFPDLRDTLPPHLRVLRLEQNQFSGNPDLTKLPLELQVLSLAQNQFCGTPDVVKLPQGLQTLLIDNNQFSGAPDWKLPPGLVELKIAQNKFSRLPDRAKLPPGLVVDFDVVVNPGVWADKN